MQFDKKSSRTFVVSLQTEQKKMNIKENIAALLFKIPADVKLVVVSKMQSIENIKEVYAYGQRRFGENRVQDLIAKHSLLPLDIEWHFIGHLQTNKVKYIAPFIHVIQSIDSLKLLIEVNKEAFQNNRIINCFLQIHIAKEETKYGLDITEATKLLSSDEFKGMENVNIIGVMGMATNTNDISLIHNEFKILRAYFDLLSKDHFPGNLGFKEISMGMSGDYQIAIEEGSTMIRIGSAIFT